MSVNETKMGQIIFKRMEEVGGGARSGRLQNHKRINVREVLIFNSEGYSTLN